MIGELASLAAAHADMIVAGVTGAAIVMSAAAVRAYGRRHVRETRRRGANLV